MGIVRKTKSVAILLEEFEQSQGAISVVDLIQRFSDDMNKTTIYRVLERLEEDGVVHSFIGKEGLRWYAKCNDCSVEYHKDLHPHFQCQSCGKVDCVSIEVKVPKIPNREINFTRMLLIGTCEACLK